jgi:hypothetical protein
VREGALLVAVALAVPIDARRQRVGAALALADVTVPHTNAADPDTPRRAGPRWARPRRSRANARGSISFPRAFALDRRTRP